jgi:ribosomal protein L11 methyltransferase
VKSQIALDVSEFVAHCPSMGATALTGMVTQVSKIEIKFTPDQRKQIYLATGLDHTRVIELQSINLAALVLAAMAVGSDSLPISSSVETIKKMLAHSAGADESLFILKVALTAEQQEVIRQVTRKTIASLMLAPDELRVSYKENWPSDTHLLRVGRSLVIVSEDEAYQASPLENVITLPGAGNDAQGVFGSGEHAATQMALMLMEQSVKPGDRVLDLGTGSGILAVAAARLGAAQVTAVDIDDAAVALAGKTVTANQVSDVVTVRHGGVEVAHDKYDLVLANIFTGVIISLAEEFAKVVQLGGSLIASGVIASRSHHVITAVCDAGFEVAERMERDGWSALLFRRV